MKHIMFVCTGNICRSAMAEVLLKHKIKGKQIEKELNICSSGISAYNKDIPTDEAIKVMKEEYDVDLSNHEATNIRNSNIKNMDLILVMTKAHKLVLLSLYPKLSDKIYILKEYVRYKDENIDVDDPYGYGYNTYIKCAKEIDECLDLLISLIESEGGVL